LTQTRWPGDALLSGLFKARIIFPNRTYFFSFGTARFEFKPLFCLEFIMLEKISYKDVWDYTWHYWRQQKLWLVLAFASIAFAGFLDTLYPIVTGKLINAINMFVPSVSPDYAGILLMFGIFVGLEVAYHSVRNIAFILWNIQAVRSLQKIVNEGYDKVQRFSSNWHANNFAGATVRKITRGKWSFDTYEDIIFMFFAPTLVVMISTTVLLYLHWPVMGGVTLVSIAVYLAVSTYTVIKVNAPLFALSAAADTKVGASLADAITANSVVKQHGTENDEAARFWGVTEGWRKKAIKSWQVATLTDYARRLVAVGMMAAMVGTSLWLWSKGEATAGDVVYVFTAFLVLSAYMRNIGEQVSNLQRAINEMEDAIWYWKTGIAVQDKTDAVEMAAGKGEIVFDKVRFAYSKNTDPIYDDFSITIRPGEKVALVGYSGSGKSTFVKLVQRLYDVQGGEIRIDGQNIADVTQSSLRKAIALVPQEPILFHRTLAENIAYAKPDASEAEIIKAAKQAYAHDFITGLEKGYDTLVGERGIKLSGGERQRVAIARAILADAPILILDEATSALDSVSEHYIQKALASLMEGRTSITIAHRLATIKSVDRILVFDQGKIVEQGSHTDLLADEKSHYKKLYDMQALDLVG
jgi:ATP-binding cassette subfamily B protein